MATEVRSVLSLVLVVPLISCASTGSFCWSHLPPAPNEVVAAGEGVRKAYRLLSGTEEFASAHVGVFGEPSCQVMAFQKLLRTRAADRAFAGLVENATLEGQLYGLAGLYLTDRDAFERHLPRYTVMNEPVQVELGCVVQSVPVSEVVVSPSSIDPSTLPEWHRENPLVEYPPVDIASGGWSMEFKNAFR